MMTEDREDWKRLVANPYDPCNDLVTLHGINIFYGNIHI